MIKRDGEFIRPGGSTVIKPKDILMVLADSNEEFEMVDSCIQYSDKELEEDI